MNWKKIGVYSVLVFLVLSMTFGVSALTGAEVTTKVTNAIDVITNTGKPIFNLLLGAPAGQTEYTGNEFAARVFALILVVVVVSGILTTVNIFGEGKGWLNFLIGLIVGLIGVRFLPDGLLGQLTGPASALVAGLFLAIPFFAVFFLLQKVTNKAARRACWVIYGVLIFILWIYNWNRDWWWMYPLFMAACAIAFWFDGTLQRWFGAAKEKRQAVSAIKSGRKDIIKKMNDLTNTMSTLTTKTEINDAKKQLALYQAELDALGNE